MLKFIFVPQTQWAECAPLRKSVTWHFHFSLTGSANKVAQSRCCSYMRSVWSIWLTTSRDVNRLNNTTVSLLVILWRVM